MRFLNFRVFGLAFLTLSLMVMACKPKVKMLKSPPHYNFSEAVVTKMDLKLREISGLVYDSVNKVFYAVNDETGRLFILDKDLRISTEEPPIGNSTEDYEDVAIYGASVYILKSKGHLVKLTRDLTGKMLPPVDEASIKIAGDNDFETLYTDPSRHALVLICKNCGSDNSNSVSAFAFYPDSIGFDNKPIFTIDAAKVKEMAPAKSSKFQPSAAAIHPRLKKLFILSSASNQLAIADLNGKVEAVYRLSPKMFPQPEGITFSPRGDLYITNEGVNSKPTILKFRYNENSATENKTTDSSGYNFATPDDKMELGKHLHEISGMAWVPGRDVILGENDEKGDIFTIDFANKNDNAAGKIKFGGKSDYEDIVYTPDAVYMLVSTGEVVQVDTKDSTFSTQTYSLGIPKNEFETMYLDGDGKSLILLCKDCHHEKDAIRAAYRFDLATKTFSPSPVYTIQISEIQKMLKDEMAEFKPSAAGINPVNGKLYIVASVGKLLVVASKDGKPEQAIRLDPVLYNQPEGMTFAPNGDLYISNEGGEGIATILKFVYKK
ncbi:MAG: SdiA-regulated domain-containing protein [Bacteroidetes bacterium]|nr:SdiA-regulated domain-containing protein [Bacteroidota bacterium]